MTATKQTELLPCPFCKREAQQTLSSGLVSCAHESCPAFLLAVTAEHWNTRAHSAEPVQGEAVAVVGAVMSRKNKLFSIDILKPECLHHGTKLYTSPAKPDAELVRQCIADELATWEGDFQGPVHTAMRCLQVRIDAKLAELQSAPPRT